MSNFIRRQMRQTATWWRRTGINEFGDPSFAGPCILSYASGTAVRWENSVQKFINSAGQDEFCRAIVYAPLTEFSTGDYLALGAYNVTNPENVTGADQIRQVERIPDLRVKKSIYKAFL
jgi:hypothetical protein